MDLAPDPGRDFVGPYSPHQGLHGPLESGFGIRDPLDYVAKYPALVGGAMAVWPLRTAAVGWHRADVWHGFCFNERT